jgi:hypothetical protein
MLKPLPKVTNATSYNDYRPIALGYHLSKIAESFIIDSLKPYISISDNQYAYREASSTTHALIKLIHDWTCELDKDSRAQINALFIDMSKAFDRMNPTTLLKLRKTGIDEQLISLLYSYLTNRTHQVAVRDHISTPLNVSVGVPQGSKLGPILWLLYIDDLSSAQCNMIKYADDCSAYI